MLEINCKDTAKKISDWMRQIVTTAGFEKVVVGLSGGVDSAVALTLAVQAVGKENVYAVLMPYGVLHPKGIHDAKKIIASLDVDQKQVIHINIKKTADAIMKEANIREDNIRKGNIMARVRMIFLFDLAKKLGALVCGTENKTENYLGYFTRFGDGASDLEPILNLYKTQVWEMAKYLKVPRTIITKSPTAGLWEDQTDEGELGFSYKDADIVLFYYFDKKLSADEIVSKGIKKEVVIQVLERVAKNDFKHHLPYVYT